MFQNVYFSILFKNDVAPSAEPFSSWLSGQAVPFISDIYARLDGARLDHKSELRLWGDSCSTNDTIHYDCFSRCISGDAFKTMYDFENCVMFTAAANDTDSDYQISDSSHFPLNSHFGNDISLKYLQTTDPYNLARKTRENIGKCLDAECATNADCRNYLKSPGTTEGYDIVHLLDAICSSITYQIDPDVGGIGVYISYWTQIGLVIIFFIASTCLKGICVFCQNQPLRRPGNIVRVAQEQLSYLNEVLVDFHQAQCFFTIAINVAALLVLKGEGTSLNNVDQLYETYSFLATITMSGYLPVTFTLFNLHLINKTYWYILSVSVAAIVVGATAQRILETFYISDYELQKLAILFDSGHLGECSFKQPWVYCDFDAYRLTGDPSKKKFQAPCFVVVLLLFFGKFRTSYIFQTIWKKGGSVKAKLVKSHKPANLPSHPNKNPITRKRQILVEKSSRHVNMGDHFDVLLGKSKRGKCQLDWLGFIAQLLKHGLYATIIGIFTWCLTLYMKELWSFAAVDAIDTNWGFGQVVALLVWVPSLSKYLLLQFCGGTKGREHSFMEPYQVVSTLEQDAEKGPTAVRERAPNQQ